MNILIASANGYGNVGDDLIADTIRTFALKAGPDVDVLMTRPPYDAPLVDWADAIIIGGGGILYDYDSDGKNAGNYMRYAEAAQSLGKPFYVIGVGEQGIFTSQAKELYRKNLDRAGLITVRSEDDKRVIVESVGVSHPVEVLQDAVFAMPLRPGLGLASWLRSLTGQRPKLAFSLARLGNQGLVLKKLGTQVASQITAYEDYIAGPAIEPLFKAFKVTLVCQSRDDQDYYQDLQKRFGVPMTYSDKIEDLGKTIKAYKSCDVVLTSRFHGLVLAALAGKPTLAAGVEGHKLSKLVKGDLPSLAGSFFTLDKFVDSDVFKLAGDMWKQGQIARPDAAEVDACRRLAERNGELLKTAIEHDLLKAPGHDKI